MVAPTSSSSATGQGSWLRAWISHHENPRVSPRHITQEIVRDIEDLESDIWNLQLQLVKAL